MMTIAFWIVLAFAVIQALIIGWMGEKYARLKRHHEDLVLMYIERNDREHASLMRSTFQYVNEPRRRSQTGKDKPS